MPTMRERASLINVESVLNAAKFFNENGRDFQPFYPSKFYDVIINGEHYPPKAIFAKAYKLVTRKKLSPYDFGCGARGPVHQKLKALGFNITKKDFYEISEEDLYKEDSIRFGAISARQGQTVFRSSLLEERSFKCQVTGTKLVELLEAAHIVPHANGANYNTSNGLLLRADIHTLYDLNLLSIDENLKIHLAPSIMKSKEYGKYHGKSLSSVNSTFPSTEALEIRHEHFLALHDEE